MKIGLTASAFDLLHAGHILMLEEAKSVCDFLICGLHIDPSNERSSKNKPIQSVVERFIQLSAVKYVDKIIPYSTEDDLIDIILCSNIDIRIIGEDYKNKEFTGKGLIKDIHYTSRKHQFSSSDLRKKIYEAHN